MGNAYWTKIKKNIAFLLAGTARSADAPAIQPSQSLCDMDDVDEYIRYDLERSDSNSTATSGSSLQLSPPVWLMQPSPDTNQQPDRDGEVVPPVAPVASAALVAPVASCRPCVGFAIASRQDSNRHFVEIVEQPMRNRRFRYDSEIKSAGAIQGVHSTKEEKSYPKIKIHTDYVGPSEITVSLVCKDEPYRVHPNGIVGKKKSLEDNPTYIYVKQVQVSRNNCVIHFDDLGIRMVKPDQIEAALRRREEQNVDPFGQGFSHEFDPKSEDLHAVRLCFQVKLGQEHKLDPVVSDVIYHSKNSTSGCLRINKVIPMCGCRLSSNTSEAKVILLSQQLNTTDLEVVFYEEENGEIKWERCVKKFDISDTSGIVCAAPPYTRATIECDKELNVVLRRPSDGTCSQPMRITYYPDTDAILKRKRCKTNNIIQDYVKKNWTPPASLPPDNDSQYDQDWRKMPGPFDDNPFMPGPSSGNPAGLGPSSMNAGIAGLNHNIPAVPVPSFNNPAVSRLDHDNSAMPRPSSYGNPAVPGPNSVQPDTLGLNLLNSEQPQPSHVNSVMPGPSFIHPAVSVLNYDHMAVLTPSCDNSAMPGPSSFNAALLELDHVISTVPAPSFVNSPMSWLNNDNPLLPEQTEWSPMETDPSTRMSPGMGSMPSITQPMSVTEDEGNFSPNDLDLDKDGEFPTEDSALAAICYNLIHF